MLNNLKNLNTIKAYIIKNCFSIANITNFFLFVILLGITIYFIISANNKGTYLLYIFTGILMAIISDLIKKILGTKNILIILIINFISLFISFFISYTFLSLMGLNLITPIYCEDTRTTSINNMNNALATNQNSHPTVSTGSVVPIQPTDTENPDPRILNQIYNELAENFKTMKVQLNEEYLKNKEIIDQGLEFLDKRATPENVSLTLGGTLSASFLRQTQGVPLIQRILGSIVAGGGAFAVAKVSLTIGEVLKENAKRRAELELANQSSIANATPNIANPGTAKAATINQVDSSSVSEGFIKSPLEMGDMDIPLLKILDLLLLTDFFELIIVLFLINIFIGAKIKNKIGIMLIKYIPIKYHLLHKIINRLLINTTKTDSFILLLLLILLLFIKITCSYIAFSIRINIDDLIYVYNNMKK